MDSKFVCSIYPYCYRISCCCNLSINSSAHTNQSLSHSTHRIGISLRTLLCYPRNKPLFLEFEQTFATKLVFFSKTKARRGGAGGRDTTGSCRIAFGRRPRFSARNKRNKPTSMTRRAGNVTNDIGT